MSADVFHRILIPKHWRMGEICSRLYITYNPDPTCFNDIFILNNDDVIGTSILDVMTSTNLLANRKRQLLLLLTCTSESVSSYTTSVHNSDVTESLFGGGQGGGGGGGRPSWGGGGG